MSVEAISHHFSDGVYAKQMRLAKGHTATSHKHNYDHLSILASGEVDIVCNGLKTRFCAPACIDIKAGIEHEIIAYKNAVFFCIHATNETDVNHIDEVLIKE